MPQLSRSQVLVYGAVAVALLLVGARAIRAEGGGTSYAAGASGGSGTFSARERRWRPPAASASRAAGPTSSST